MSAASQQEGARSRVEAVARVDATLRAHEHRTAAGLFALFVLIYLWPALVAGDVLSPGSGAVRRAAMAGVACRTRGLSYYNALLSDVPTSYHPWAALARELLHAGTFPAWNPHAFAGTPLWGQPLDRVAGTPFQPAAVDAAVALRVRRRRRTEAVGRRLRHLPARARAAARLLARAAGRRQLRAVRIQRRVLRHHGAHVSVAVLLPWMVWLAERIVRRGGRAEGVALAVVVAAALAGGHPGTQLHVLSGTLIYERSCEPRPWAASPGASAVAGWRTLGAGMAVGGLSTAVVLLPGERAAIDAIGGRMRGVTAAGRLIGATMPLEALRATAFPDWWGRPSEALIAGPANYSERAFYAGALALILAVVAVDLARRLAPQGGASAARAHWGSRSRSTHR